MADLKTEPTGESVTDFLNKVEPEEKRGDSFEILQMMEKITGEKPKMRAPSIIGFGKYRYKPTSGHEGDMRMAGFSPRKQAITIYLTPGFTASEDLLKKLGNISQARGVFM